MVYYEPCYVSARRREPSIFDGLTLNPLPYPILLILLLISIFLGIKFYFSYEEAAESAEFRINWLLLATPLILIFAVKWLSSFQRQPSLMGLRHKWACYGGPGPSKGASPWGVAALIVLLLVLLQFQSVFFR